jgi:kumamolisin
MTLSKCLLAVAFAASLAGVASAVPYPHGAAPAAVDLGDSATVEGNAPMTVTVALNLRNRDALDQLIAAIYTPGKPQYRQFLTTEQFREQFGPSAATIAEITKELTSRGLAVTPSATAQLHVTGTAAQMEKVFGVQLHSFAVPATTSTSAYGYHAPVGALHVPAAIAGSVRAVLGLDSQPRLSPHLIRAAHSPQRTVQRPSSVGNSVNTPDPPGEWTVIDYADYYDVNPVYRSGVTGKGRTLAIVTLASFTPSDAYTYWSAVGVKVQPNRITEVQIDGGSGPPSDESGSDETTLDVEQSGGLSPGAKIIVYEAPNNGGQGFVDDFAAAIDANQADTISTSWGLWELFDSSNPFGNGPVNNPVNGRQTTILDAEDDLLAQAAVQGQSLFCSSGDYGAYDELNSLPSAPSTGQPYSFNGVLSVDDPAVQRYITAGGGTTLPGKQVYTAPNGSTITLYVPEEMAWSWQYLSPLCEPFNGEPPGCFFPIGTGGGVSIYVQRPFYQWFVPGMANSVPGQTLLQLTPPPVQVIARLPAGFPGRNVPDISSNADPQTGYLLYYTSSVNGFEIATYGGTSFVAPQLNGVTSLFVDALHHRIGLLTPALYQVASHRDIYRGLNAPLRDITTGTNWYWYAGPGYDQTTGVGVPDVANLLDALQGLEY